MTNKIKNSNLDADIVSGATELSEGAATGDYILFYDTSAGTLKKITQTNFLNFPTVSSVSPTNLVSGDGTGNYTIVITGSGFTAGIADLINDSGSSIAFDTVTVDSDTQITGVIAKSSLPGSGEPYDVRVTATSGLKATLENQINIDQQPVFSTASGSLGTVANGARSGLSFTVAAADPESGGDVTYTLESGSLPSGLSLTSTSSGAIISGDANAVSSNTTSNFTIRAKDVNSNTSDRAFSITVNAPISESFTSSGTFSVPSGVSSVDVLVVAGGGAGGNHHGAGGGAGGLIYRPGFPVTPGGTVSVTVGNGADNTANWPAPDNAQGLAGGNGQNSVFGTLTAIAGGGGGTTPNVSPFVGANGGSGGGGSAASPAPSFGQGTQPNQAGDSGTYGFGNNGGAGNNNGASYAPGGGGGAGAVGQDGNAPGNQSGNGGIGKAYTIADGSTPVYYAGGGGGSGHPGVVAAGQGGQGGGGQGGTTDQDNFPSRVATANRGGGGGGADRGTAPNTRASGGAGGKGIVIVRY